MWAKLTLYGLNEWGKHENIGIFDTLTLPDDIDKDVLISQIMLRGAEFPVIHPEPSFMQNMISAWGKIHYSTFEKWITALNIKYEPLYNYDRHEEWSDNETRSDNGTSSSTLNSSDESSSSGGYSDDGETENKVSAFDTSSYQPHDKTTTTLDNEHSENSTSSRVDTGNNRFENKGTTANTRIGRMYGNIGVTTSQQMLEAELEIDKWNIYEHIANMFISEFLIPIYI